MMTTATRHRSKWQRIENSETYKKGVNPRIPTTKKRQVAKLPTVTKPYICDDDAGLVQLVECYGYLVFKPNGYLWLTGLVPKHQREAVAERIKARLMAAKEQGHPGACLVAK